MYGVSFWNGGRYDRLYKVFCHLYLSDAAPNNSPEDRECKFSTGESSGEGLTVNDLSAYRQIIKNNLNGPFAL